MKTIIRFAAMLGIFVLIGGMGYYHLVIIREMRHAPQANADTGTDPSLQ